MLDLTRVYFIVGNVNSTREFGHWIGLDIVLIGKKGATYKDCHFNFHS